MPENGFPDVENPIEELLCITPKIKLTNRLLLAESDFKTDRTDITYVKCKNEKELIFEFMKFSIQNHPDIIKKANTKFFDLPYLMNRIKMQG